MGDKGDKSAARPPEGSLVETRCLIKGPKFAIVPFAEPHSGPKSKTGSGVFFGNNAPRPKSIRLFIDVAFQHSSNRIKNRPSSIVGTIIYHPGTWVEPPLSHVFFWGGGCIRKDVDSGWHNKVYSSSFESTVISGHCCYSTPVFYHRNIANIVRITIKQSQNNQISTLITLNNDCQRWTIMLVKTNKYW